MISPKKKNKTKKWVTGDALLMDIHESLQKVMFELRSKWLLWMSNVSVCRKNDSVKENSTKIMMQKDSWRVKLAEGQYCHTDKEFVENIQRYSRNSSYILT